MSIHPDDYAKLDQKLEDLYDCFEQIKELMMEFCPDRYISWESNGCPLEDKNDKPSLYTIINIQVGDNDVDLDAIY
jgi:hypothetical protein